MRRALKGDAPDAQHAAIRGELRDDARACAAGPGVRFESVFRSAIFRLFVIKRIVSQSTGALRPNGVHRSASSQAARGADETQVAGRAAARACQVRAPPEGAVSGGASFSLSASSSSMVWRRVSN